MTKEAPLNRPKPFRISSFGFNLSFVIRASSFFHVYLITSSMVVSPAKILRKPS